MPCWRSDNEPGEVQTHEASLMAQRGSYDKEPPLEVKPVPRFIQDLAYLAQLTEADTPPRQLYWASHSAALFVIGNASRKAKGTVVVTQYGLDYESGVWSQSWRGKLSNIREAENLTDQLEQLAGKLAINVAEQLESLNKSSALTDPEVFVLTDNSAFKGSYYKGHSMSRELSDIVF
jgi:hypothetical protein